MGSDGDCVLCVLGEPRIALSRGKPLPLRGYAFPGYGLKGDHLVWPQRAHIPLHKLFLENGSPSPSCNSFWQRQCKWLWDNKRGLCLQGRNKNANIFGMKKQRRFTPWYFLSVLCICLCFTFSFLSFGLSNKALGSDVGPEGARGRDGADGWGLQPLWPSALQLCSEMLFPPMSFAHFRGVFPRRGFGHVWLGRFAPTHPTWVRPVPGSDLHQVLLLRLPENFCTVPSPGAWPVFEGSVNHSEGERASRQRA